MALHVPPVANETEAIHAFLAQAQDAFRALLHGLTPRQASLAPSASTLSVGGLIKHVTGVQRGWLASAEAAPEPAPERGDSNVEDYLDGFTFRESDSLADLVAAYDEVCAAVLDGVRRLDLDTPVPVPDAPWFPQDVDAWNVRWVWWHLMEELARHAGHGDIVRETIDGATMYSLVAARDGLPDLPWLPAWKPVDPPFTNGVSTVRLHAADLPAAHAWYADLLGAEPYFVRDEYVEWRVGPHGQELGILDLTYAPAHVDRPGAGGSVTYWEVDDVDRGLADLVTRGATVHEEVRDFGAGYRGAVVDDPFGNALGIMQRPAVPTTGEPAPDEDAA
jgi:predicted enzyme related to lactoylglutathione lyase